MGENEENDGRRARHHEGPPILIEGRVANLETRQRKQEEEERKYKNRQLWFNFLLVLVGAATVGVYAYQASIMVKSLEEIRKGGSDTHDLAVSAGKQADRTKDLADRMKEQAERTKTIAEQAKVSAEAAKSAADTAAESLRYSKQALRISERPYVTVENVRFDPALEQKHLPATVKYDFHNAGRTPALKATYALETFIDGKRTEDLPIDFPAEITIPSDRSSGGSVSVWIRGTGDFEGLTGGTRKISIKGTVKYTDTFKDWHTTKFCTAYDSTVTKSWVFCPGNDVE